ncbi:glutamate--cysteine ligase [Amycolatopsis sp., V23-08]|uniref:Putative glutamate--cysteine ligase 2 n=1 Tax=Amycolatopsis heterodermiae TaxID=3110235 RepID=A0ABU5RAR7_9PSEU|nr:glutamate--cysteine ligase [Amycolatopsis sp., V23-08]MEA5363311.1 glutamate--cysteine ligase [Amycolatopsis sp., V23-08]
MTDQVLTFGVEEEFFVVDRRGLLSHAGDDVVDAAEAAGGDQGELQHELTRTQAEAASDVCRTHSGALSQLRGMRADLASAAGKRGLRLLPSGCAPLSEEDLPVISPTPRYQQMAEHFGATARTSLTCGCHVHVAIPDKETGIRVLARVRPWLPALLTVTANSPIADGYDTGYHSWRYQQWSRWPSAGPPPKFGSLDEYESVVDAWLRAGSILDRGMVYWDVRLSENQPTLEFRIADVAATPEDAVLLAVLARGLVATALDDDAPPPDLPNEVLRAQLWRASRDGVSGRCPHPRTGDLEPASAVLDDLIKLTSTALEAAGDREFALEGTARLATGEGGADRQRRSFAKRQRGEDVVDLLAVTG